jgi:hypothetical protein
MPCVRVLIGCNPSHDTALSKPAFEVVRILEPSTVSEALGTAGASGEDVVWYVTVHSVHVSHDLRNDIVLGLAGRARQPASATGAAKRT